MQYNIYLAGVGGQGVVRLSEIIARYAMEKGKRVKFYKEIGLAQRGGPVHCEVRIGDVFGPRIPPLSSNIMVIMELSEVLKALELIKPKGVVILNKKKVYPIDMMAHPERYPKQEEIIKLLNDAKAEIIWIDAEKIALEVGLPIAENNVLLGALSSISSFDKECILNVLRKSIPREIDKNIAAFNKGYEVVNPIR
ncbi:2-oxoacid:acceptor oxidoreductase family protein [Candidatus Aerophobetes bacterium]|nr:2-oxoacid:acceptor oxidoreductase family protein [Candidatus Aerophobetes bacterium]